jgi:uncharacterized protein YndB with AHSA1/START domain
MTSGPGVATAQVVVDATPDDAFAIFTDEIGLWWRTGTAFWNDPDRAVSLRIEPYLGGRFVELYDVDSGDGFEVGRVTAWEPGKRLALTWTQRGWPEDAATEVEVRFEPTEGGTRVRLEHSGFDRIAEAEKFVGGYDAGWKQLLGWFAEHLEKENR